MLAPARFASMDGRKLHGLRSLKEARPELLLEMVGERTPTVRGDVILLSSVGWLTLAGKYGVIVVWCDSGVGGVV